MTEERAAPDALDRHIGVRLRARRREHGLSQQYLGERVGVSFQQIQKYERGANRISAATLYTLASALGAPLSYFFEGLPDPATGAQPGGDIGRPLGVAAFLAEPGGAGLMKAYLLLPPSLRKAFVALAANLAERSEERLSAVS
jgi:transcriptional regulator with XRE-family HTH domain